MAKNEAPDWSTIEALSEAMALIIGHALQQKGIDKFAARAAPMSPAASAAFASIIARARNTSATVLAQNSAEVVDGRRDGEGGNG
jgi:hypothetical protein